MCDSPELLAALAKLTAAVENQQQRGYIDQTYYVSDTQGFVLDYKGYRYLYVHSAVALTFKLGSILYPIIAEQWTPLAYKESYKIFTSGQSTPTGVTIRATDDVLSISGSFSISNVNPNGQTTSANSSPVVLANDGILASATNPGYTEDFIRGLIAVGQGYSCTLEALATNASNAFVGIQLVANSITKNIMVFRATAFQGQAFGIVRKYIDTHAVNDTGLSVAGTVVNLGNGAAASALTAINVSPASTTETTGFQGSQVGVGGGGANTGYEALTQGDVLFIPKNTTGSISVYTKVVTSTNTAGMALYWVEF